MYCTVCVLCAQLHVDPIPFHMFFRVVVVVVAVHWLLFSFIKTRKTLASMHVCTMLAATQ